jgi:hypothetical protein
VTVGGSVPPPPPLPKLHEAPTEVI